MGINWLDAGESTPESGAKVCGWVVCGDGYPSHCRQAIFERATYRDWDWGDEINVTHYAYIDPPEGVK